MPVVSVAVRPGDPTIQASGRRNGMVTITFDDGRIVEQYLSTRNAITWTNKVASIGAEVQDWMQLEDAESNIDPDTPIDAIGEASHQQRAVAYLRRAWKQKSAYDAWKIFDNFNNYRNSKGWTLDQVQTNLGEEAGLTVEEWTDMRAAYSYLNNGSRPTEMANFQTIQDVWNDRNYRET